MDEILDIVTENGVPTGKTELKSIVHKKGYFHHTAHIWLYTKQGEVLLQQRAASKAIHPLLWDVSVAGHIDAGETIKSGAVREIKEEIGLNINESDLQKIGVFKCFKSYPNGIIDNEFHNTFLAELKAPLSALKYQNNEVEALKLVALNTFKILLNASETNSHFVSTNKAYYLKIIKAIKKKL